MNYEAVGKAKGKGGRGAHSRGMPNHEREAWSGGDVPWKVIRGMRVEGPQRIRCMRNRKGLQARGDNEGGKSGERALRARGIWGVGVEANCSTKLQETSAIKKNPRSVRSDRKYSRAGRT